jgi:hypothetical protein
MTGVACKQKKNYAEKLLGINMVNEFEIFEKRINSNTALTKIPIIKVKEKSDYCAR